MGWWRNLSSRERLLVGLILPLVAAVLFYLYLWQPTYSEVKRLRLSVPEKNATLAWMRHRLSSAGSGVQTATSGQSDGPILTVLEQLAISAGVKPAIQRVQPGNDGSVEVWYQEVVADQLFRWIDQLASAGISVQTATITRLTPGLVSARVKVQRPDS